MPRNQTRRKMRTRDEITALTHEEKLDVIREAQTAYVVDAMNLLGLKRWWLDGLKPLKEGQKVVAPAFPFRLERIRKDEPAYNAYYAVESCPAGYAMVIANIKETFLIGGNVATQASLKGIRAFVLEASNRDVADIRKLPLAVYSQGTGAHVEPSNIPVSFVPVESVEIGGGKIYKEDIIFGDDDGVIAIPSERLDDILYQLELISEVEREAEEVLKKGVCDPVGFYKTIIAKKAKPRE